MGHYGSLLGSGPYGKFAHREVRDLLNKKKAYGVDLAERVFPGSISVVELASGKLLDRLSSVHGGAHCHFAVGSEGRLYLPHQPSLVKSRTDTLTNPAFAEGASAGGPKEEFKPTMRAGFGTSIAYDEKFRQVLIPTRWTETLNYFSEATPEDFHGVELRATLPEMKRTHGLAFHPDGKHYVITGDNWLAALERGTHRLNPDLSFPVSLFVHAHTSLG